jgi:hypothetical protein
MLSLTVLAIAGLLVAIVYWRRTRRAAQNVLPKSSQAGKFDTTLGDFHDMREALRPLAKVQVSPRQESQGKP